MATIDYHNGAGRPKASSEQLMHLLTFRLTELRKVVDRIEGIDQRLHELGARVPRLPRLPDGLEISNAISGLMEWKHELLERKKRSRRKSRLGLTVVTRRASQ